MIPKWFDKSPDKSNDDNIADLAGALTMAGHAYATSGETLTAFGHFASHYAGLIAAGERAGRNALTTNYGAAVIDRAVLDACCRVSSSSFYTAIRGNLPGIDCSLTPDLRGFDL